MSLRGRCYFGSPKEIGIDVSFDNPVFLEIEKERAHQNSWTKEEGLDRRWRKDQEASSRKDKEDHKGLIVTNAPCGRFT